MELFEVEDVLYKWSTQDCMTMDSVPYIGRFGKDDEDLFIATGYNKWGMTNSMVSAMIIGDLIVKGHSPWENVYNPSRINITASAKTFIKKNANTMIHFMSNRINLFDSDDLDLENGQCKIIVKDGNRLGAYKDEEGNVHIVDTTCTHLKCEVNWNSAEKSWDCPCHGSRFDYKGDILHGPALKPLKKYS